jgi:peptidoglycan/xylan/chitin deacetylase (PgdA/CDA1 family)
MQNSKKIKYIRSMFVVVLLLFLPGWLHSTEVKIVAFAYHDVVDTREELTSDGVTLDTLVNHFEWLLASGYQPVSIDQLLAAKRGEGNLPQRPVLLCWDDGYKSFYTHVLPLLTVYNFPAVLALVGAWMDTEKGDQVLYGSNYVPRDKFLSWEEVRRVKDSGFVEIASHSMGLHVGELASPSGDKLPAAIAYIYDEKTGQYEPEEQYLQRIRADLEANSSLIEKETGSRPRVMVWPFGRYNQATVEAAAQVGMEVTLTLDPEAGTIDDLSALGRSYPTLNPDTGVVRNDLEQRPSHQIRRYIKVKMEDLLEEDRTSEKNFSVLLERLHSLQPGGVIFEPVLSVGNTPRAFFPTKHLPVEQDRLLRLLWHSNRRGGVNVFLWLDDTIFSGAVGNGESSEGGSLLDDLGRAAPASGVILAGKSTTASIVEFSTGGNAPDGIDPLSTGPNEKRKTRKSWIVQNETPVHLRNILSQLEIFQRRQPYLEVSFVLSAEEFFKVSGGQLALLFSGFDYIFVDFRSTPLQSVKRHLARELQGNLPGVYLAKIVPLLQFEKESNNGARLLAEGFNTLRESGFINGAYGPDNFLSDMPHPEVIREAISTASFPVRLQ